MLIQYLALAYVATEEEEISQFSPSVFPYAVGFVIFDLVFIQSSPLSFSHPLPLAAFDKV